MKENDMSVQKSQPENLRDRIRPVVPKLIDLTEKVLFGDVWERPQLSKRDRSLITCAALVAMYRPEQLRIHLARALDNGLSKDELGELITHLAFYAGWPAAVTAAGVAKTVFDER
jgi:4-carboxymuconolactone decarboxylase